jgi:putative DNA primase/helicase
MQEFVNFARDHGLIMNSNLVFDKWVATPTEDHPRSSNGRYKFLGDVGWVINWATMEKPVTWFADRENVNKEEMRKQISSSNQERNKLAKAAAEKAEWILSQCSLESHPYLERKGFNAEQGNVFVKQNEKLLVIPMRINGMVVGCQLIDHEGNKKFLHGQTSKGATFTIGTRGTTIFCEGYATGLSVRDIMTKMNLPYTIHICFSANNMELIARNIGKGLIIADNDSSGVGESIAKKTQQPYWISPARGEDFNDYHMRVGNFKASQDLKRLLLSLKT